MRRPGPIPSFARATASAIAIATACGLGAGCGGQGTKLEGRWKGVFVEGVPPEAQASSMAFAKAMEIDFKGDAVTVTTPDGKQTGSFVVDSENSVSVVIHTEPGNPQDRQTFTFSSEKAMKWLVTEGKPAFITFTRD